MRYQTGNEKINLETTARAEEIELERFTTWFRFSLRPSWNDQSHLGCKNNNNLSKIMTLVMGHIGWYSLVKCRYSNLSKTYLFYLNRMTIITVCIVHTL